MENKEYRNDNITLREESTKVLLSHIFDLTRNDLTEKHHQILEDVIVHEKTFAEMGEKSKLSAYKQKQIFEAGLKSILLKLSVYKEKADEYSPLVNEVAKLKKEIDLLKNKPKEVKEEIIIDPEIKKILATAINETSLSARVKNICRDNNIKNVGDLVKLNALSFLKFRNSGRYTISGVEDFLYEHKLRWGMFE